VSPLHERIGKFPSFLGFGPDYCEEGLYRQPK
jgi:hypothetical protein